MKGLVERVSVPRITRRIALVGNDFSEFPPRDAHGVIYWSHQLPHLRIFRRALDVLKERVF